MRVNDRNLSTRGGGMIDRLPRFPKDYPLVVIVVVVLGT